MSLIATKFKQCLVVIAIINVCIFYVTAKQTTHWTGNITSPGYNTSTATTQYKNELNIVVTQYSDDQDRKKDITRNVVTSYQLLGTNSSLLINLSNSRSDYHQYFRLDDKCSLILRRPRPENVHDLAMVCRH
ncbi:hypothetical protein [Enterovibrio norvegicus]|uniref:hypothetical protein n=1 Tax=Enterovibrio norvegicus TaxID=188144 RepID=UPI000C83F148|nr:hypothetical protein [Enterovibrio norvegicus]PML77159.1 hypothetical protein BCT69_20850 [Enterovibrio norvegicus]PMN65687.1 hypothetical protein BCT27_09755 [Enterovibrio norvegicus]